MTPHKKLPLKLSALIVVAFLIITFGGKAVHDGNIRGLSIIDSFNSCKAHGYAILESYPEVCITSDGRHFTNPAQHVSPPVGVDRIAAGYITGNVTIGPFCPVERADMPCTPPPEAYTSREVIVYALDKTTIVTREHLSADGSYKVTIGPGDYFIQIAPAGIGPGEMKPVRVNSFQTSTVDFDIDTGIR